jgi:hypothetical protein
MNHRDNGAEIFLHTGYSERAEYPCVFPKEENSVCKQRSSSVFVNSRG